MFEVDEVGLEDDHGDTAEDATPVRVPSSTTGRLETSDDQDYFRIILDEAGSLTVRTTGSTNTSGELTRKDGTLVDDDEDSGDGSNFRIVKDVQAGTYYVRVSGDRGATGSYTLHMAFEADEPGEPGEPGEPEEPDEPEVGDDHGDTADRATAVDVPSSTSGRLETSDDVDYFRIDLDRRGTLLAYTTGSVDTVGELTRQGGTVVDQDNDGGSDGSNFRIETAVAAGVYLVRVSGDQDATGAYGLHLAFDAEDAEAGDDHGDTADTATPVPVPSSTAARLETSDDVDFFRIALDTSGILTAYTTGSLDTYGELRGTDGATTGRNDDGGDGSNFRMEVGVDAGFHYVRLRASGAGGDYTLHIEFDADDGRFQTFTFSDGIEVVWRSGLATDRIASALDYEGYVHIAWVDGSSGNFDQGEQSLRYCRFDGMTMRDCVTLHPAVHRIHDVDMAIGRNNTVHISYGILREYQVSATGSGNHAVMYSQIGAGATFTQQISTNPTNPDDDQPLYDRDAEYRGYYSPPRIQVEEFGERVAVYYRSGAGYMVEAESEYGVNWEYRRVFRAGGTEWLGETDLNVHDVHFEMPPLALRLAGRSLLSTPPHIFGASRFKSVDALDRAYASVPTFIIGTKPIEEDCLVVVNTDCGDEEDDDEDRDEPDGVNDMVNHRRTDIDDGEGIEGFNYWRSLNSLQMYLVDGYTQMSWHWTDREDDNAL